MDGSKMSSIQLGNSSSASGIVVCNDHNDIGGSNSYSSSFHEFKKQASFFLKEKIKTARLALTDVTPAQLVAEEATNGSTGGPDARTLNLISKAAFEVDDYWRIVDILHKILVVRIDKRNWRASYKALIVVEHLLTHGPDRIAEEFQSDTASIKQMESFKHIDHQGFNWGLNVRKKCQRILKLLEKGPVLKEERDKARKTSRGIQGFGSFCLRTSSSPSPEFGRSNSDFFQHHSTQFRDLFLAPNENDVMIKAEKPFPPAPKLENLLSPEKSLGPDKGINNLLVEVESKPLLGDQKDIYTWMKDDDDNHNHHPFDETEGLTAVSLLL